MNDPLPTPARADPPEGGWSGEITPIVKVAHALWSQPADRRRMRAYGFRPAVEEGVLKREWHGTTVRVSGTEIRTRHAEHGELAFLAEEGELLHDGRPFDGSSDDALRAAEVLISLINDYERWIEVREGRASRMRRHDSVASDRRPVNAIAETRRLQRLLGTAWGRPPTRRR